ncbi:DEAD/DEAH box helicase family protein [Pirellulaceae bacterium SH449]
MSHSPFLNIPPEKWLLSNQLAFAIYDGFPVSPGHVLVITKRLVPTWFDASPDEQKALMSLVNDVKQYLDSTLQPRPAGYNVGFNAGEAAGQTVMHIHVHVIPRYIGDMPDPRGGVRHVIPSKGNYLAPSANPIAASNASKDLQLVTGHPQTGLWDQLSSRLIGARLVDILASFVQNSGLDVIENRLFQLLQVPSTVRIMVSDYLSISDPAALKRLCDWQDIVNNEEEFKGNLIVRLVEMDKLPSQPQSFHPKSWRIIDSKQSFIAVGSSNLSRPALVTGVEWNLLSSTSKNLPAHDAFESEFNLLWSIATPLTLEIATAYASKAMEYRERHFEPERQDIRFIPEPRPWQILALKSLQEFRNAGYHRALVAVATGMGKTWLAAFDARQVGGQLKRRPRVLVIAHRSHILVQAESALSTILDDAFGDGTTSWYIGQRSDLNASLVIASVQKLARPEGLSRLASEHFDYVIIDEVHHAHAPTYRRVMAQLNATFVLGLTATPERGDGVDVATIFDDNLAYHATIGDGIAEESLVPFHYVGIRDTVDFQQIPWRNGRFDLDELEKQVSQSERMQRLGKALQEYQGDRTIVFCCSRRHALFTRDWLRANGVSSAAVFSGEGGDSQIESLDALRTGKLATLCVVDMFNEGLDIPAVDRVVMLRPTESKVIFLQQLGRGLRASVGKTRLLVIDFVGNHRIFAQRMLHLLSLGGKDAGWSDLHKWLQGETPELPAGCLLDVSLEARDIIAQFVPVGTRAGIETYRALRDELGRRPLASELFAHSILPKTVSKAAGSWFEFVESEGDMSEAESKVLEKFKAWLVTVETTSLNKSYKMVVLRVLLDYGCLFEPINVKTFSKLCRRSMLQHPVLRKDLLEGKHSLDHQKASDDQWAKWWTEWSIDRWLDVQNGERWFELSKDKFRFRPDCPLDLRTTLESMTEELVDWRLSAYSKSHRLDHAPSAELCFDAKVSHSGGRAILFLPDTTKVPGRPTGLIKVRLPNQSDWEFKFAKVACNVANPAGVKGNELHNLLMDWFGENAGLPGTDFKVTFESRDGQWYASPLRSLAPVMERSKVFENDDSLPFIEHSVSPASKYKTHVPVHNLVAAAGGWGDEVRPEIIGWIQIKNKKLTKDMFVAKVSGRSMEPRIPDGSWCLFRSCPLGSKQNRLLLVQVNTFIDAEDGGRYTVKKYRSSKRVTDEGWENQSIELVPLNPLYTPIVVTPENVEDVRIIGEFVDVVDLGML